MKYARRIMITFLATILMIHSQIVNAASIGSEANIEFLKGDGPTEPVDPEDPSKPMEPEEPEVTGSLAIIYLSSFNFGSGKTSPETELYDIQTEQPNIQIVDLRGTNTGWALDASVSGFTNAAGKASLPGAVIHIKGGRLNSAVSPAYAPTVSSDVKLTTDNSPNRILTADSGKGAGLWIDRLYPENEGDPSLTQLEIPAGAITLGSHTAQITWTLSDTP